MRASDHLARQAQDRPDQTSILDHDGTVWSFAALHASCQEVSQTLKARGIQAGDRVMIVTENAAATAIAIFAAQMLGAWAVPVNARLSQPELDRFLAHARPAAVLLTVDVSPDATQHAERLGASSVGLGLRAAYPYPSNPADTPDIGVLLYTTGTTGTPKAVMLSHGNLLFGGHASAWLRDMQASDVVYGALPMSHVFGLTSMLMAAMEAAPPGSVLGRMRRSRWRHGFPRPSC